MPKTRPSIILDHVAVGIIIVDADWNVLASNSTARSFLHQAATPEPSLLANFQHSQDTALLASRLKAAASGRVTARNLVCLPRDRGLVIDLSAEALSDAAVDQLTQGSIIQASTRPAALVTLQDATARAAAESEASRLRDRLAESETVRARLTTLQAQLVQSDDQPVMIGASAGLARVRAQIARVAPTDTTVLVQGETGSGKELVARSIHAESPRSRSAFVAVNCAALPESLIESELFGHERGAFTGADRRRLGKFELADGGTLFLDEIAEMPLAAQAKLLRVLQGGAFERVGGVETVKVDVRVVAATHRDLARRVERSLFREDLYYRLNVFRIDVPPLRDRREDLRELVEYLHARFAQRMARPVLPLSERSLRRVMAYRWPGNIRELANAVERATLLADGPELDIELPEAPAPMPGGDTGTSRGVVGGRANGGGGGGGGGGRQFNRPVARCASGSHTRTVAAPSHHAHARILRVPRLRRAWRGQQTRHQSPDPAITHGQVRHPPPTNHACRKGAPGRKRKALEITRKTTLCARQSLLDGIKRASPPICQSLPGADAP